MRTHSCTHCRERIKRSRWGWTHYAPEQPGISWMFCQGTGNSEYNYHAEPTNVEALGELIILRTELRHEIRDTPSHRVLRHLILKHRLRRLKKELRNATG